jgi:hypothetical protein
MKRCRTDEYRIELLKETVVELTTVFEQSDGIRTVEICLLSAWKRLSEEDRDALRRLSAWEGPIDVAMADSVLERSLRHVNRMLREGALSFFFDLAPGDARGERYAFVHVLAYKFVQSRYDAECDSTTKAHLIILQRKYVQVRVQKLKAAAIPDVAGVLQAEGQTLLTAAIRLCDDDLSCLSDLLGLLVACGQFRLAASGYRWLTERLHQRLGLGHQDTLSAMSSLAATLAQLDDLTAARPLQEQVLASQREVLDERHSDKLSTVYDLVLEDEEQVRLAPGDLRTVTAAVRYVGHSSKFMLIA